MVILWTDVLMWAVATLCLLLASGKMLSEQTKKSWQQVFRSPVAIVSCCICLLYFSLALLDSFHFKHQSQRGQEVVSTLDWVMAYRGEATETSYSSPMATHAFAKTQMIDEQKKHWGYAPLHAINPSIHENGRWPYIGTVLWKSTMQTLLLASLFYVIALLRHHFRYRLGWKRAKTHCFQQGSSSRLAFITLMSSFFLMLLWLQLTQGLHVLGTDKVGIDITYKVLKSIRTGFVLGILTTLIVVPFALLLGCLAGYCGGWIDGIVQYCYTTISSIPGVLLIAFMILTLQIHMANHPESYGSMIEQADRRLFFLCLILGLTSWTGLCRLIRGETLKLRALAYVDAARALGASSWHIIRKHMVPNVFHLVLIAIVLDFSGLVLAEAVLSYVGVGVDPSTYSWGNMINSARLELAREPLVWWPLLAAFSSMLILVLSANLFSERVREAFDPKNTHIT